MEIINTKSLTKKFGATVAVDDISIHVKQGEIYGFLGLNGAGKTTLIRMFLGMIQPNAGDIALFGKSLTPEFDCWNDVGFLVESPSAYPDLSVKENLDIYLHYRKLKDKNCIEKIMERLRLTRYHDVKARHLSLGNLQRLGLAKALMHEPKLLILDEPVNGLDPAGIVEVRELLKELVVQGSTVFLSSHILGEVSKLASRIGIIHEGRLIKEIYTHDLENQLVKKLLIHTNDNRKAAKFLTEKKHDAAVNLDHVIEVSDDTAIQFPENVSQLLVNAQFQLKQLFLHQEDLETFFLRTIGKEGKS